jgi:hypothetical protein
MGEIKDLGELAEDTGKSKRNTEGKQLPFSRAEGMEEQIKH